MSLSGKSSSTSSSHSHSHHHMKLSMPHPSATFLHPTAGHHHRHESSSSSAEPAPLAHTQSDPLTYQQHDHDRNHHHIHTPHPTAATTDFLDKHVPVFAKHHREFAYNHEIRHAKKDARRSTGFEIPIPSIPELEDTEVEHILGLPGSRHDAAEEKRRSLEADRTQWEAVLASRAAARMKSGAIIMTAESTSEFGSSMSSRSGSGSGSGSEGGDQSPASRSP